MTHYRCYILNASDDIVSVDSVEAEDDSLALSLALGLLHARYKDFAAIEIWDRKRMVGQISSDVQSPSKVESLLKPNKSTSQTGSD